MSVKFRTKFPVNLGIKLWIKHHLFQVIVCLLPQTPEYNRDRNWFVTAVGMCDRSGCAWQKLVCDSSGYAWWKLVCDRSGYVWEKLVCDRSGNVWLIEPKKSEICRCADLYWSSQRSLNADVRISTDRAKEVWMQMCGSLFLIFIHLFTSVSTKSDTRFFFFSRMHAPWRLSPPPLGITQSYSN